MSDDGQVDVLVVGDLNPDLLVRGDDLQPRWGQAERDAEMALTLGGSGGICAAGLARIGLRTEICATVGDDALGDVSLRMLADHGVRPGAVRRVPGGRTGTSVHLLERADRAIYTERGAMVDLTADDALARLDPSPRHVHLAAVFLLPAIAADGARIVAAARAAGATVSVDTNFDPDDRFVAPGWLTHVDLLLPNEAEVVRLSGRDGTTTDDATVEAAARELAGNGAVVVVKRGAAGAFAIDRGERIDVGVAPTSAAVVDAVGAGDSFDAGYVRALLDGRDTRGALALASAAGTLSTRAAGGTGGQATLAEATAFAARVPA